MREHLSQDNILKAVVGLRPYRRGGLRLEQEELDGKHWVHNYGHGGSGITVCWGCAEWVARAVDRDPGPIAVLGGGVIGLTVAHRLAKAGRQVTVYARDYPPTTTSDLAGGLWAPTHMALDDGELRRDLLTWSWDAFSELKGKDYGVSDVTLYQALDSPDPLDPMPDWLVGEGRHTERLPFGSDAPEGLVWQTYLIQTSTFLPRLVQDLQEAEVELVEKEFRSEKECSELSQPTIVNCLGLGAGELLGDPAVVPIRGQLLYLKPVKDKMVVDHSGGYVISRDDVLILGGTFEEGESDLSVSEETSRRILEGNRSFDWGSS